MVWEAQERRERHPAGERLERRTEQEHGSFVHRPKKLDFFQKEMGNWKVFTQLTHLDFHFRKISLGELEEGVGEEVLLRRLSQRCPSTLAKN